MKIKIKRLRDNVKLPTYGTEGAAAFDFYAPTERIIEGISFRHKIPLGIAVEIPPGYALFIVPRSSTGLKTALRQSNSIGVIDSDYRGEIALILDNIDLGNETIKAGERIAQGFIIPIPTVEFEEVDELSETVRGEGGFGSTGV